MNRRSANSILMAAQGREPTVGRLIFSTRQYSRIVNGWAALIGLDPENYVPTLCDAAGQY